MLDALLFLLFFEDCFFIALLCWSLAVISSPLFNCLRSIMLLSNNSAITAGNSSDNSGTDRHNSGDRHSIFCGHVKEQASADPAFRRPAPSHILNQI